MSVRVRSRATEDEEDANLSDKKEIDDYDDDDDSDSHIITNKSKGIHAKILLKHWHVYDDTMFEKYAPSRTFHGFDENWESNHLALLRAVFEPLLVARINDMPRRWFRTYRRALFPEEDTKLAATIKVPTLSGRFRDSGIPRTQPLALELDRSKNVEENKSLSGSTVINEYFGISETL